MSDTTSPTLLSFLLAMMKYPKTFQKLQEEIDTICGTGRSPALDDLNKLPYPKACMNEVIIPHTLIQDDIYERYFPPKGTMLFANARGIHRDEDEYELPDKFIPARFMS